MLYSNIKNKVVVSISTANKLGQVKGVYIDKTLRAPIYLGVEGDEGAWALKISDVFCHSDIITVLNDEAVAPMGNMDNCEFVDMGAEVYDVKAFFIGSLTDIKLTPTSPNALLIVKDCHIKMQKIISLQSKTIIVNTQRKQLKNKLQTLQALPKPQETAAIAPAPNVLQLTDAGPAYNPPLKQRTDYGYNFLLGRRLVRDIVGINQELLIKKDTIITPHLIEQARKTGKLIDLSLNSK